MKVDVEDIYELTPLQEGMLFYQMNAVEGEYFVQVVYDCVKTVCLEDLRDALELLSKKHEVLRTMFVYEKVKSPVQAILKERIPECKVEDISKEENKKEAFEKICKEDIKRGFHFAKDTLLRVTIVKISDTETKIIWSIHHIIIDGWSNSILFSSFLNYYGRILEGESKEKIIQEIENENEDQCKYGDYVRWLKKQDKKKGIAYWSDLLNGYEGNYSITSMGLHTDTDKPVILLEREIKEEITGTLNTLVNQYGVTLNTFVEAAFGLLLQMYNYTNDVTYGKVVSGRNADVQGIEDVVGLFINTIPLRVTVKDDMKVSDLIKAISEQSIESTKYDFIGLSEIQEQLNCKNNFINIIIAFENYYVSDGEENKPLFKMETAREQTNYDVTFGVNVGEKLVLNVMYRPEKYSEEEMQRVLEQFENILGEFAKNPEGKVTDIDFLTTQEREQILQEFNDTKTEYPSEKSVIQIFEEMVEQYPDKIAVEDEQNFFTYKQLNEKANQIANRLKECGVGKEDFVAIVTEKSIAIIAAICGILKVGGIYVPIDPSYPKERNQFIMDDCKPVAIIWNHNSITLDRQISVINMSTFEWEQYGTKNLGMQFDGRSAIYCLYTSGTTGKPKGNIIENRNVVRLVKNTNYYDFPVDAGILQAGSLAFDASTFEIWGALLNGGRLIFANQDTLTNPAMLKAYFKEKNINAMFMTVTLFNQMVQEDNTVFEYLDYLSVGGERHSVKHDRLLREYSKKLKFNNGYGPTENTTFTTYYDFPEQIPDNIPIGKPIANTQVYIMNQNRLCGIGMIGELCAAGDGVGRGYLNREELTKEKFVENPFGEGRMYRSGDLVRWMPDGNIEFIGRIDEQVKIRGFRIELTEIENALCDIPFINDATVIVRENEEGDKAIHAYFESDTARDCEKVKDILREKLPEYMIPVCMIQIDKIPSTTNGKVDKRALPEIQVESGQGYVEPRTELERLICNIFQEVLLVKQVGIYDDFFALGGHSLKATKLLNRIQKETNKRIPIKDIFSNSTVIQIVNFLNEKENGNYKPIPQAEKKEYYPMSSAQKRVYFIHIMEKSTLYNMPQCLRIEGKVDYDKIKETMEVLIKRHEILRTRFLVVDGEPVQQVMEEGIIDLAVIEDFKTEERKLVFDLVKPFDLDKPSQFRIRLIRRKDCSLLFIDMHHIIGDGMSMVTFTNEFTRLYNNEKLDVPAKQYKDYSEWLQGRQIEKQKNYWLDMYQDEVPVLNLPVDFHRPLQQSFEGAYITKMIDLETTNAIKTFAKRNNVTDYMVFLSSVMILLGKYSRQEDIVVGTPISGRIHKDTEQMMGMFVNTLALRGYPVRTKDYLSFLQEIKSTCLKAYENQEYPFEALVDSLEIVKDTSHNPLFDVMFAFQNNDTQQFYFGNEIAEQLDMESKVAKFDLTFNINDTKEGYMIDLEYCTKLFTGETIEFMLEHYINILKQVSKEPKMLISAIDMTSQVERKQIIDEFNATTTDYPRDKSVATLLKEQVDMYSDNIAVIFKDQKLTYQELDDKSGLVAKKLADIGVGKGDFVSIYTEKCVEMVIGLCAILKAGAAYVPIDPHYPNERIQFILEDCKPKVMLSCLNYLPFKPEMQEINIAETVSKEEKESFIIEGDADAIAYCIYTSGTTGRPKGSLIRNRSIVRLVKNTNYLKLGTDSIIMQTGSMAFDASTLEMWGALLNGGELVLADEETIMDSAKIKQYIRTNSVNTMWMTATLFNQMIQMDVTTFDSLKYLLIGGEKLSEKHVSLIKNHNKEIHLINGYGPTENTTFTATYEITDKLENIPIGKPIANTKIYILEQGQLCGITVPGELCTSGDGVATGYLNIPELTKEKFIENPYGEGLLYRTGDLARWLPDGNIDYLGRIDAQVKIRGFRIELEEIENTIRKIDDIKDVAVILRKNKEGEKYLNAYFVSESQKDSKEIKTFLKKMLPDYMIPNGIMQIDEIPVTRNGKINKTVLPEIAFSNEIEYEAPRNQEEQVLCDAFCSILQCKNVGINDNFFDLGGDSIKAIRLVAKVREAGYELTIKQIMSAGCIRDIQLEHVAKDNIVGEVKLTGYMKNFVQSASLETNQKYVVTVLQDRLNENAANMVVAALLKKHSILRAEWNGKQLVITEFHEGQNTVKVNTNFETNTQRLFEAILVSEGDENRLMFAISPLLVDMESIRIIKEDVLLLWNQIKEKSVAEIFEQTSEYITWNAGSENDKTGVIKNKANWEEELSQFKVASQKYEKNEHGITAELNVEYTDFLLTQAMQKFNTTMDEFMAAVLMMAVKEWKTESENITILLEKSNHNQDEFIRTVGNFVQLYPVLLTCSDKPIDNRIIDSKEKIRKLSRNGICSSVAEQMSKYMYDFSLSCQSKNWNDHVLTDTWEKVQRVGSQNYCTDISVVTYFDEAKLKIVLYYVKNTYKKEEVENLLNILKIKLEETIDFCIQNEERVNTISDYAANDLSLDDLDIINSIF